MRRRDALRSTSTSARHSRRAGALARLAVTGKELAKKLARGVRWRRLRRTEKNGTTVSKLAIIEPAEGDLGHHRDDLGAGGQADAVFGQRPYRAMIVAVGGRIGFRTNIRVRRGFTRRPLGVEAAVAG